MEEAQTEKKDSRQSSSLRIRHPKPRLDSGIPRHDEESRTADLPDIPASEHRRQNLDASRLSAREFRDRRSTAGRQTGIGVSGFF